MEDLLRAGYELIPLRPRDKRPLEAGWRTSEPLSEKGLRAARAEGLNVGVRLRAGQLVIDIDPRNFAEGRDPARELGIGEIWAPRVLTPSGGTHVYIKVADIEIKHTLRGYAGLEFKTLGRQVVAPGSTHPNGGIYEWDPLGPGLDEVPECPAALLALLTTPTIESKGEAEWTCAQLAEGLAGLSIYEFQGHDEWFSVMCAAHEATGGAGVEEFIGWSMGDELYSGDEASVRVRWRSLKAGQEGNAGAGTLRKLLLDRGAEPPAPEKVEDFEGVEVDASRIGGNEDLLGPAEVPETLMRKMSRWFKCVNDGGRLRIFERKYNPSMRRHYWERYSRRDFMEVCVSQKHLPDMAVGRTRGGDVKFAPASVAWLDWYKAKETYEGAVFDPMCAEEKTPGGWLNLWRGFSVKAKRGEWGWLRQLIYEVICSEDDECDTYVMNWLALAVQKPWEPARVALVLKGMKGVGKGTLGRAFVDLFGGHGLHISSPDLVTGRFNAHLEDCAALFADEAFWAGDKTGEGKLKALITEPMLAYEGKGQNARMGRNCLHVLIASNSDWVVPASTDERRFAMIECSGQKWLSDDARWVALTSQMNEGGLAAMLWDLLHRDLSDFKVTTIPETTALMRQKVASFKPHERWLYELLLSGDWAALPRAEEGRFAVLKSAMQDSLMDFYRSIGKHTSGFESSTQFIGQMLRHFLPSVSNLRVAKDGGGRIWAYELPELDVARDEFEKIARVKVGQQEIGQTT